MERDRRAVRPVRATGGTGPGTREELTRAVNPADRLDHDGKEWNITGIKEAKFGRHQFLEITATADL